MSYISEGITIFGEYPSQLEVGATILTGDTSDKTRLVDEDREVKRDSGDRRRYQVWHTSADLLPAQAFTIKWRPRDAHNQLLAPEPVTLLIEAEHQSSQKDS